MAGAVAHTCVARPVAEGEGGLTVLNLAGEKLALCAIAAVLIVAGTGMAVWPRRFAEPDEDRPGEPPTAA